MTWQEWPWGRWRGSSEEKRSEVKREAQSDYLLRLIWTDVTQHNPPQQYVALLLSLWLCQVIFKRRCTLCGRLQCNRGWQLRLNHWLYSHTHRHACMHTHTCTHSKTPMQVIINSQTIWHTHTQMYTHSYVYARNHKQSDTQTHLYRRNNTFTNNQPLTHTHTHTCIEIILYTVHTYCTREVLQG